MKLGLRTLSLLFFISFISYRCSEDNNEITLQSGTISVSLDVATSTNDIQIGSEGRIETDINDFEVKVLDAIDSSEVEVFPDASLIPDAIELAPGDYFVTAANNETRFVAFDAPQYKGTTNVFTIESNENQQIDVVVTLSNVKVSVVYDQSVTENASEYNTLVSSSSGSLNFGPTETRSGYFVAGEELVFTSTVDNSTATTTIDIPNARDHFIINVSYVPASGSASINIQIDEATNDIPIDIEVVEDTSKTSFNIWKGAIVTFSKTPGSDPLQEENQDRITNNVWITRQTGGGQIFNAAVENGDSKSSSPSGTEWALGTTDNIENLTFAPFRTTIRPQNVVGRDLVLHLIEDDIYIDVTFTSWTRGRSSGGGFSYERSGEN